MVDIITHKFVSAKADSPDPTLVSASEWNEGHVLTGGQNGHIISFDNTQPNNIKYTQGAIVYSGSHSALTTSPTPNIAPIAFTAVTNCIYIVSYSVKAYAPASGTPIMTLLLMLDAAQQADFYCDANARSSYTHMGNVVAGAHTFALNMSTAGNITANTLVISGFLHLIGKV